MLYMVTFTINIPQMLAYIPYMDSMGMYIYIYVCVCVGCVSVCMHHMPAMSATFCNSVAQVKDEMVRE